MGIGMKATPSQSALPASPEVRFEDAEQTPVPRSYRCDHCGRSFSGTPGGAGLLVWTRGDEVRYEEPPLCDKCASKLTVGALVRWDAEDEEEG
jgi:hypothetical protein